MGPTRNFLEGGTGEKGHYFQGAWEYLKNREGAGEQPITFGVSGSRYPRKTSLRKLVHAIYRDFF